MAGLKRGILPLAAAMLVGVWFWLQRSPPSASATEAPATLDSPALDSASATPVPARPSNQFTFPGAPRPPPIESASPAEIAALRQAEVAHSKSRPPVATYKGIDGRQHAFKYELGREEEARQAAREDRQAALMRELEANPAAFSKKYGLQAHAIERILDGSMQFPPELLE